MSEFNEFPEVPFHEFKSACYLTSGESEWMVKELHKCKVTPNFHYATFEKGGKQIQVLCNSIYPIVAFTHPVVDSNLRLQFLDVPELRNAFECQRFEVASTDELTRSTRETDLTMLDPAEIEQIKYWKPETIGEIIFNWFD